MLSTSSLGTESAPSPSCLRLKPLSTSNNTAVDQDGRLRVVILQIIHELLDTGVLRRFAWPLSWPGFVGVMLASFVALNLLFAPPGGDVTALAERHDDKLAGRAVDGEVERDNALGRRRRRHRTRVFHFLAVEGTDTNSADAIGIGSGRAVR